MAKKRLRIKDSAGNPVDYDVSASSVTLENGTDVETKINELGTGNYNKPNSGIPKTDLEQNVQDSLDKADSAIQGVLVNGEEVTPNQTTKKVGLNIPSQVQTDWEVSDNESPAYIKNKPNFVSQVFYETSTGKIWVESKGKVSELVDLNSLFSSVSYNSQNNIISFLNKRGIVVATLNASPFIVDSFVDSVELDNTDLVITFNTASGKSPIRVSLSSLGGQGTVQSVKMNGGSPIQPVDGVIDLGTVLTQHQDISVESNGNGIVNIIVDDDTYTINLNHTHPNMVKMQKFVEGSEPDPMSEDTIYVQVDDLQEPSEIQKLYLFGLAFEGGGGVIDESPRLTSPSANTEIDFNGESSTTLRVKGLYLSVGLTITQTGGLDITSNGSTVSTISATDANDGILLTIAKGANFTNDNVSITISSSEVSRTVSVHDSTLLPGGLINGKAWATQAEHQSPVELNGYCITPFYYCAKNSSNNTVVVIKSGMTVSSSGLSWVGTVYKKNESDSTTNTGYRHDTDPKTYTVNTGDGRWLSATFKVSELDDCYFFDKVDNTYKFAGKNIDQTKDPDGNTISNS